MFGLVVLCSTLLTAQAPVTKPEDPKPAPKAEANPTEATSLAKYNAMIQEKAPDSAAAHWKMALWCEQNGLRPEAYVHLGKVIELDPKREAAWQKLGFKKYDGRWMTPQQIAAETDQKKADKDWTSQLKKWHKEIHGGKKQADAQAALDKITDPSAVPSIYREFGAGGSRDQEIAIQMLSQIDGPVASKVIALLSIYGKSPTVRRIATETLRSRKPEEFLDLLVGLMSDELKYEVRPVSGVGSAGVLFVEGERFNVRRFYSAPPPPNIAPRPGDLISYDAAGMPMITHFTTLIPGPKIGIPGSKSLVREMDIGVGETYSYSQAIAEAQKGAAIAQSQLTNDVAMIDAINGQRSKFNELVMNAIKDATGKSLGKTPKECRDSLASNGDRYKIRPRERRIPTLDELVPIAANFSNAFSSQLAFTTKVIVDS
jgi:hypothetical protein